MGDKLYQQAVLNILWSRQFVPEVELQRIVDTLATAHQRTHLLLIDTPGMGT